MPFKAHELRDRAESLRRMAREATVEREREALGRRAAENLVSMVMERQRSSLDRNSPH
jgi:ribosomal protein L17